MNVADLIKLIHDGLVEAGKTKVPVVKPGTPISVVPCVVIRPGPDSLENGNRTLRYGFEVVPMVPRQSQPEQYELLVELEAICVRSLVLSNVRFDGPMYPETPDAPGEPPAQARAIPISFVANVDLCS